MTTKQYATMEDRALAAAYLCTYERHTSHSMAKLQGISPQHAARVLKFAEEQGYLASYEVNHRKHITKRVYMASRTTGQIIRTDLDKVYRWSWKHVQILAEGNNA